MSGIGLYGSFGGGGFDEKFNAALANKLKNQDVTAGAAATNADASMMHAQTDRGLAPSLMGLRSAQGQAGLLDAGSNRLRVASQNPMGFSSTQVGSMGLGSLGVYATPQANEFGRAAYGTGAPGSNPAATAYLQGLANYQPGAAAAPTLLPGQRPGETENAMLARRQQGNFARGGPIGDVEDDTGRDTRKVMARPGEYFLNPETVTHGFGGGNYDHGVRNLDEIVRRSTGQEPGPTYSKKGQRGFDKGGVEPRKRKAAPPAAQEMSDAQWNEYIGKVSGKPNPIAQQTAVPSVVHPDVPQPMPAGPPAPPAAAPGANNVNFIPRGQQFGAMGQPGYFTPPPGIRTDAPGGGYFMDQMGQAGQAFKRGDTAQGLGIGLRGVVTSPLVALAESFHRVGQEASPFLSGLTGIGEEAAASKPVAVPAAAAAPAAAPRAAGFDASADAKAGRGASTLAVAGPQTHFAENTPQEQASWAIRNKIQGGGKPGEQITLDYGSGHGMGPTAAPIMATADKTGRFNSFSGQGLRVARGGAIPMKERMATRGMRMAKGGMVPGFASSGPVQLDMFGMPPPGVAPTVPPATAVNPGQMELPLEDPLARANRVAAEALRQTADARRINEGTAIRKAAEAAEAEAKRTGTRWQSIASEPVDVQAGLRKGYEAVKSVAPSSKTVAGALRIGGKVAVPIGAGLTAMDIADVATDPNKTKLDVANEVAGQASRWAGATAGGIGGAAYGSTFGPLGTVIGGLGGGAAGYFGTKELTKQIRSALGMDPDDPSVTSKGFFKKGEAVPVKHDPQQEQQQQVQPPQAAAAAPPKTSLRDLMMLRAMALGGGGEGAMNEQKNLLGYLGQTDTGRSDYTTALQAAKYTDEHQKEIDESLRPRFKTTIKDDKGNPKEVDDLAAYERFKADMVAHGKPIYQATRSQIDAHLAEWRDRDVVAQKAKALSAKGGMFSRAQFASDRTRPVQLENDLTFSKYMDSPGIPWQTYAKSFLGGKGLRNQVAKVPYQDPRTGEITWQSYGAGDLYMNDDGTLNIDQLSHARPPAR